MDVNYPPLAISFSGGLGAVFANQLVKEGWMPPLARRQSPRCPCRSPLDALLCTRSRQRSRCWMLVPSRAPPPCSHLNPGAGCRTCQVHNISRPPGQDFVHWANTEPLRVLRGCVCWQHQQKFLDRLQQLRLCLGQIPKWVPSLLPCWLWPRPLENRLVQVGICFR